MIKGSLLGLEFSNLQWHVYVHRLHLNLAAVNFNYFSPMTMITFDQYCLRSGHCNSRFYVMDGESTIKPRFLNNQKNAV